MLDGKVAGELGETAIEDRMMIRSVLYTKERSNDWRMSPSNYTIDIRQRYRNYNGPLHAELPVFHPLDSVLVAWFERYWNGDCLGRFGAVVYGLEIYTRNSAGTRPNESLNKYDALFDKTASVGSVFTVLAPLIKHEEI